MFAFVMILVLLPLVCSLVVRQQIKGINFNFHVIEGCMCEFRQVKLKIAEYWSRKYTKFTSEGEIILFKCDLIYKNWKGLSENSQQETLQITNVSQNISLPCWCLQKPNIDEFAITQRQNSGKTPQLAECI